MRMAPIEHPQGLAMQAVFWFMKRKFGKVIMPLKVVTARMPKSLHLSYVQAALMEKGFSLDKNLQFLLHAHISQLNQCAFCIDIAKAQALREGGALPKIEKLAQYRSDPAFSDAERAALAYVEEITLTKTASDATFDALKPHFSDTHIVEITLLNALENSYNLTNRPLGIESDGLCDLAAAAR